MAAYSARAIGNVNSDVDQLARLPEACWVRFEASCCPGTDLPAVTAGVYADRRVLEAKSLLRCSNCQTTWLLIGQARREQLAEVTSTT
jgi:hypothetical protein